MAKMKAFRAEYGTSVQVRDLWYKFYCAVELEPEPKDTPEKVRQAAWDMVVDQVEVQIEDLLKQLGVK